MPLSAADLSRLSAVTMLDLSRLPAPDAIEALDYESLLALFKERFLARWEAARATDPTLPSYDVEMLETDPAVIVGQAWSELRLLDRGRVNDAVRAVLAPLSQRTNLDLITARMGVFRLVLVPEDPIAGTPAVMESDARLLRRYLLAFGRPAAGSAHRYQYEALTAVPLLHDVAVIGRVVHGRRGDTDIVLAGPAGRAVTPDEITAVRARISAPGVKPEATSVTVLAATRRLYDVSMHIIVPRGPDADAVRDEVVARVGSAAEDRRYIEAEVPRDLLAGAAYGLSVLRADLAAPAADIPSDPYTVPEIGALDITVSVAG